MDAVDPELVATAEAAVRATPGVEDVGELRLRWIGHALRAEVEIVVDPGLALVEAHHIAHDAEHRLLHDVPRLSAALVHAHPHPEVARRPMSWPPTTADRGDSVRDGEQDP